MLQGFHFYQVSSQPNAELSIQLIIRQLKCDAVTQWQLKFSLCAQHRESQKVNKKLHNTIHAIYGRRPRPAVLDMLGLLLSTASHPAEPFGRATKPTLFRPVARRSRSYHHTSMHIDTAPDCGPIFPNSCMDTPYNASFVGNILA
jgi:hypothetical protein